MAAASTLQAGLLRPLRHHLEVHDPERASLKTALRAAIVIPIVFAFTDNVIGNPQTTLFSAFGSFSLLVLADFSGSRRSRLTAYVALAGFGAVLVTLGTLCSRSTALGVALTVLVGFSILFAGLINRYFAAASLAALLSFILSVNFPAPVSAIPDRLEGWLLASAVAISAQMLLWPPRERRSLRPAAARACAAIANLLQAELDGEREALAERVAEVREAGAALRRSFVATPYRPTGATGSAKALALLIDELEWLRPLALRQAHSGLDLCREANRDGLSAVIAVLRACGGRLNGGAERPDLERLVRVREAGISSLVRNIHEVPLAHDERSLVEALEPSFRLRALSYATWEVGANALLAMGSAAPRADWGPRRRPSAPGEVVRLLNEHAQLQSVWFRNSVRGAAALAIAVYVAQQASLQRAFWVVLGTLSVLRSNALGTGSTILQAVAGTALGIVVGGGIVALIGAGHALLWAVLPFAILLAAYAPRAISFAAGQAAFTMVLLILFNIIVPTGWRVGLVRLEDVAVGFAISFVVGLLFWPRGARAVLRESAADAYASSAHYFAAAATADDVAVLRPVAVAAAHRLDDAYRQFLAEPGHEQLDAESLAALVTGATRLRLGADSLVAIAKETGAWGAVPGLEREAASLRAWYLALADVLRRSLASLPPQTEVDGERADILRHLDSAVASGDQLAVRAAGGAALADEHVGALRGIEPGLARAVDTLAGAVTTPESPQRELAVASGR